MAVVNPADERVPVRILLPLAVQHLLVMTTGPISSVFLVSHALKLDADMSARLLAAFFLVSAIGTAFQSTGWLRVRARLPFVMLPGGAAVALFIQIAQQAGARTTTGAVLLTAVCCFALVPVFLRIIRLFPPLVLGVMVVVIGVNLLGSVAVVRAANRRCRKRYLALNRYRGREENATESIGRSVCSSFQPGSRPLALMTRAASGVRRYWINALAASGCFAPVSIPVRKTKSDVFCNSGGSGPT